MFGAIIADNFLPVFDMKEQAAMDKQVENQYAVHEPDGCQACYACAHAYPKMAVQFTLSRPEKILQPDTATNM